MRAPCAWSMVAVPFLICLPGALSSLAAAGPTIIHAKNPNELQAAFRSVPDGGVIELAAGGYAAPARGFSIANPRKGFTVRAAAGAAVALDGQGKVAILRFVNGDRSKGKRVTFQRLTFQNGFSITEGISGAVTLSAAEARFERCNFLNNAATGRTTGGGAVGVNAHSLATFLNSTFRNNSSGNRGGALSVIFSSLTVQGGAFTGNRTNLPGHSSHSSGGAIYILDSLARISDAHFERNQAGWTGGAIYAFGTWTDPVTTPKADVTVIRSTFAANQAVPDPCCASSEPTSGGALHAEDQTTLRVQASQLFDNAADNGGAIDAYRAVLDVGGSLFQRNRSPVSAAHLGVGGAVYAASNDGPADVADRRPARVTIADSLLQGGFAPPAVAAHKGGCLFAEGDQNRMYGRGIAAGGTLSDNRSRVELRRVTFSDCDVAASPLFGGGFGGAVAGDLVDLVLDGSVLSDSDARGDNAGGGGLALQRESTAVITGTTFAHDSAVAWGGGLFIGGSAVQVTGCRFFRNEVATDGNGSFYKSRGAAIFSIPQLSAQTPRDVAGVVSGSVFSENIGVPIWDTDPASGPINDMHYDGNQIYSVFWGNLAYVDTLGASNNGLSIEQLNSLVVFRGGRPSTPKSRVPNVRLFTAPQ